MLAPPQLPRNLEASFRDLDSTKPDNRVSAIHDLLRHARDDEAVRARAIPLLEMRLADVIPKVRAAAAVGLADLVATGSVPALLRSVDDDDAYVRQMALNALGELGDARALPRLRRGLTEKRSEMRYQSIIAFARLCEDAKEVGQALLTATNDDDDAVVHIALRIAEERLDAGKALDERLVTRARALLESGRTHLMVVAAILLGKSGESDGNALLLRVVRGDTVAGQSAEKEDERAVVELVGALGLTEARPHLERRAWGLKRIVRDTCAFHAKIALARMKHPRATDEIMKDLASTRPDLLGSAVVSAGRARLAPARPLIAALAEGSVDPELVKEALAQLDEADAPAAEQVSEPA